MLAIIATTLLIMSLPPQQVETAGSTNMTDIIEATQPFVIRPPGSRKERRQVDRDLRQRVALASMLDRQLKAAQAQQPGDDKALTDLRLKIDTTHRDNIASLMGYAEQYGWFPRSTWDWLPGWNAWLLLQSADADLLFQQRLLATMTPLLDSDDVALKSYAYLFDHIAARHDVPQRWGTQGQCTASKTWKPHPLEDPLSVDRLRNEASMEPLAQYAAFRSSEC